MAQNENLDINRRFLQETEQSIRLANNEIIHERVPPLDSERMLTFAKAIAKLRAKYIEAAFAFADVMPDDEAEMTLEIEKLELYRHQFEAARDAFLALQRAIEMGYVAVDFPS